MVNKKLLPGGQFLRRLLICFFIVLFLGAVGCIVLYRYAAVYEVTRPETLMDELMDNMSEEDWYRAAKASSVQYVSEFEDAQRVFDDFYDISCKGKDLTYRQSFSKDDSTATFVVRAGNVNLYEVHLSARDDLKPGFGRHYWQLEGIQLADFTANMKAVSVEILAPADGDVLINGTPVTAEVGKGTAVCPYMTEIEASYPQPPQYNRYLVEKLFGDVRVTDSEGNELSAEYVESEGVYRYVYVPQYYSVTIEAPDDVTVSISGRELTGQDAQSTRESIFTELLDYTDGNEWSIRVFSYDNLVSEPVITATDADGNALNPVVSDTGRILFFHLNDAELENEARDDVDEFFTQYMNYSSSMGRVYGVLSCTLRGSKLNKYLLNSTDAMMWASDTSVSYKELEYANFYRLSENCLYCTIQYQGDFSAKTWYENYSYEMKNGYEMVFVKSGEKWLAAEMSTFQ